MMNWWITQNLFFPLCFYSNKKAKHMLKKYAYALFLKTWQNSQRKAFIEGHWASTSLPFCFPVGKHLILYWIGYNAKPYCEQVTSFSLGKKWYFTMPVFDFGHICVIVNPHFTWACNRSIFIVEKFPTQYGSLIKPLGNCTTPLAHFLKQSTRLLLYTCHIFQNNFIVLQEEKN